MSVGCSRWNCPHRAADRLDDNEKDRTSIPTLGGPQEMPNTFVAERLAGIQSLTLFV